MAAIYLHIPFCKQACHYCDFHFSTALKKKEHLVEMLCRELLIRQEELGGEPVECIYFGGGTPSLLSDQELAIILDTVYENFPVARDPEITLEANPDDLSLEKIRQLACSRVNRLSIGVQSFFQEDLEWMNRAHNASEAMSSIQMAQRFFENISIDLIYGIPGMDQDRWAKNLDLAIGLDVPHISSYALTVEPGTALQKFIEKGKIRPLDEEAARNHFELLIDRLTGSGFEHYEFSNFGKPGYFSRNNTAYWLGKPYLGIGPSAHSYDGRSRKWNISNNALYIKSLEKGKVPFQSEALSTTDRYNEYVMTRLRTRYGVGPAAISEAFGPEYRSHFLYQARPLLSKGFLEERNGILHITREGKFLSDGIAADLFFLDPPL